MGNISISRKDILWSYIAKTFQIGTSFFTLPLVLHLLSAEEIGMNYLMITVSSLVILLDLGFSSQFSRNFSYVHSGAKQLQREGVNQSSDTDINYRLLSVLLKTAKFVYSRLSIVCTFLMLTIGTLYMYKVTDGFKNIHNSFLIWMIFCLSNYFKIYFLYYNSLLTGSGKIEKANKAIIYSRVVELMISISMLLLGFGLFSIVVSGLISPFVSRFYSYRVYYSKDLVAKLPKDINKTEIKEAFTAIWYNSKKYGINIITAFCISRSGMFLIGIFLPLSVVGAYGLIVNFVTILQGIAQTLLMTYNPQLANYKVTNQIEAYKELMGMAFFVHWFIMLAGCATILFIAPWALELINSQTSLPPLGVTLLIMVSALLDSNQANFAGMILIDNKVPFVKSAILSGFFVVLFNFLLLKFTDLGLMSIVLSQFIVQLSYNNWKWPKVVLDEYNISFVALMSLGVLVFFKKLRPSLKSALFIKSNRKVILNENIGNRG